MATDTSAQVHKTNKQTHDRETTTYLSQATIILCTNDNTTVSTTQTDAHARTTNKLATAVPT